MALHNVQFTADASGNSITFVGSGSPASITIDSVSLRKVEADAIDSNFPVTEFLIGNTDNGKEIIFRVDLHEIEFMEAFEYFCDLLSVEVETDRGSLMKCFISLEGDDFYELQGTIVKDVSIIKIHSSKGSNKKVPPTRSFALSWRDSSKQRCRLLRADIQFTPGSFVEKQ